jgi:hypothetical protein
MMKFAILFCFLFSAAQATDVDPKLCRDVDASTRSLVPVELSGWYKYPHGVQVCPVYDKHKKFLWWIATIREDLLSDQAQDDPDLHPLNPDGFTRKMTPQPYIITENGKILGRLSDLFPSDPPGHAEVFLSQWHDDFPYRIDIKVKNAAVMGDYDAPPLQWNPKTQHYDQIGVGWRDLMPPPLGRK